METLNALHIQKKDGISCKATSYTMETTLNMFQTKLFLPTLVIVCDEILLHYGNDETAFSDPLLFVGYCTDSELAKGLRMMLILVLKRLKCPWS